LGSTEKCARTDYMTDNLVDRCYGFFTNAQLSLLKVAAMYFDILVLFDLGRNHEQGKEW